MPDFRDLKPAHLFDPFAHRRESHRRRLAYLARAVKQKGEVGRPVQLEQGMDILRLNIDFIPIDLFPIDKGSMKYPPDLSPYDAVIVGTTNPDLHADALLVMQKILARYNGRIINAPHHVLRTRRDQIAKLLAPVEGLKVPTTVRISASSPRAVERSLQEMSFPVILRSAGYHIGLMTFVARDLSEAVSGAANLREKSGQPNIYATAFHNYRSNDGLYRKLRFFFIGEHIVFRHQLVSDHWNVHARDRDRFMKGRPALINEERELIRGGFDALPKRMRDTLRAIGKTVPLDYFGIDCAALPNGELLLFEANATMNFLNDTAENSFQEPPFQYLKTCLPPAVHAFRSLVGAHP